MRLVGRTMDDYLENRAKCARNFMPLMDELPYEVRQAIHSMGSPTWTLIIELHAAHKRGVKPGWLLRRIRSADGIDPRAARSAPSNLTLSQLEI